MRVHAESLLRAWANRRDGLEVYVVTRFAKVTDVRSDAGTLTIETSAGVMKKQEKTPITIRRV